MRTGIWLMILSGITFGLSGSFATALMDNGWSPGGTLVVRLTGAAAITLVIAAIVDRRGLLDAPRHFRTVGVYGSVAVAGVQATFFLSMQHLSVGVTLMIQFLAPIVVIAWEWLVRKRPASTLTIIGTVVALVGAAAVIDVFGGLRLSLVGLGWAGLSMLGNACFFLLSERTSDSLAPIVLLASGMTVAAATAGVLIATQIMSATFATDSVDLAGQQLPWYVPLFLLITVSTVLAYVFGVAGGSRIGSTLMSLVLLSEVLFASVFAWLLIDQSITVVQMLGGAAIVGGVAIARLGGAGAAIQADLPVVRDADQLDAAAANGTDECDRSTDRVG
ncbi:DMT family transporter [Antrihabitans sp. YC3-6]|uniref:DMT family transporter n=1 Tax=Antrihabitans stalagmiti TaxID=2799499 RepID=A0A934NQ70_9NOCA|nr:DMT family transporter [Antrihabitans stalagmiti]MBJ8339323.1 DMT family transporter [Antrihabitans stalagmiti]